MQGPAGRWAWRHQLLSAVWTPVSQQEETVAPQQGTRGRPRERTRVSSPVSQRA